MKHLRKSLSDSIYRNIISQIPKLHKSKMFIERDCCFFGVNQDKAYTGNLSCIQNLDEGLLQKPGT